MEAHVVEIFFIGLATPLVGRAALLSLTMWKMPAGVLESSCADFAYSKACHHASNLGVLNWCKRIQTMLMAQGPTIFLEVCPLSWMFAGKWVIQV